MAVNAANLMSFVDYRSSAERVAAQTHQLFEHFKPFVDTALEVGHDAVCVAIDGTDPLSNLGRDIERRAFETLADNLPADTLRAEYEKHEDRSLFLLGLDVKERRVVAAARLIVGAGGLGPPTKTLEDIIHHPQYRSKSTTSTSLVGDQSSALAPWLLNSGSVGSILHSDAPASRRSLEELVGIRPGATFLDVSTLARVPDLPPRDAGVTWTPLLAGALFRLSMHLEVTRLVAFLTTDLLNAIRQLCGSPWRDLGELEPVHYVPGDSFTSQPAYLDVREFSETLESRSKSGFRRPLPEVQLFRYALDPDKADAFMLW